MSKWEIETINNFDFSNRIAVHAHCSTEGNARIITFVGALEHLSKGFLNNNIREMIEMVLEQDCDIDVEDMTLRVLPWFHSMFRKIDVTDSGHVDMMFWGMFNEICDDFATLFKKTLTEITTQEKENNND